MTQTPQRQSGIAEVNGTTLPYEVAGEGHPLTLIHGGLVDRHFWDDQFDVFAQHYKVIRYDMRGFGDAGLVKQDAGPYSSIEDLYSLLTFLGIEKTYLMGLSMGGALAIDFTLEHPGMIDALIPVGMGLSGFKGEEEGDTRWAEVDEAFKNNDIARAVELTLQVWTDGPERKPEEVDVEVRERVRQMTTRNFRRSDDVDAPEPQGLEPPAVGRLSEIHVPTLIIVGDKDVKNILAIAAFLEKGISGARKVVIPNTAHHLNMEKPQEFNQVVLEFLSGLQQ